MKPTVARIACVCGDEMLPHGRAAHERGMSHQVAVEQKALEAQGLYPISQCFRKYLEAASLKVVVGPLNWHRGGIGRKGKLTHALYVPDWVRTVVRLQLSPTSRRGIVIALARCTPEERELRLRAGHAAWELGAEPMHVARVYTEGPTS